MIDADEPQARRAIDVFLSGRGAGDVVVVYLSCHGVLDRYNRLYFAVADTMKTQLSSTGIPAAWLLDQLEECRARQQVLILDCCFSGAFAHGSKGDADLDLERRLAGHGRGQAVLTASRAGEYSFEGQALPGAAVSGSVFTAGLVEGLRTGDADAGGDGYVSVDEAYDYAYRYVQSSGAARPRSGGYPAAKGRSCSPAAPPGSPSPRPHCPMTGRRPRKPLSRRSASARSMNSASWLTGDNPAHAVTAEQKLRQIADTDNPTVAAAARAYLTAPDRATAVTGPHAHSVQSDDIIAARAAEKAPNHRHSDQAPTARLLDDAERTAQLITDNDEKTRALLGVAEAVAASDPDRAARLLDDAERTAQLITDKDEKTRALLGVAEAVAASDPDRAARLLDDAERAAQLITDDEKTRALRGCGGGGSHQPGPAPNAPPSRSPTDRTRSRRCAVATAVAASDPDRAERIVQSVTTSARGRALAGWRRWQPQIRTAPNASPSRSPTSARRQGR